MFGAVITTWSQYSLQSLLCCCFSPHAQIADTKFYEHGELIKLRVRSHRHECESQSSAGEACKF